MTDKEAQARLAKAGADYKRTKDGKAAREALQEIFAFCFEKTDGGNARSLTLDGAYSLLRRVENNAPVAKSAAYRYDAGFVLEGLVFCAEVLLNRRGVRFVFENATDCALVCVELKAFCRVILSILANAEKYTDGGEIAVRLNAFDNFAAISVADSGSFDGDVFQKALLSEGSLGFVCRTLRQCGGSIVMTSGGRVLITLKIPLCKKELPIIMPFPVEDLLYDRLSVIYTSFCGHALTKSKNNPII